MASLQSIGSAIATSFQRFGHWAKQKLSPLAQKVAHLAVRLFRLPSTHIISDTDGHYDNQPGLYEGLYHREKKFEGQEQPSTLGVGGIQVLYKWGRDMTSGECEKVDTLATQMLMVARGFREKEDEVSEDWVVEGGRQNLYATLDDHFACNAQGQIFKCHRDNEGNIVIDSGEQAMVIEGEKLEIQNNPWSQQYYMKNISREIPRQE